MSGQTVLAHQMEENGVKHGGTTWGCFATMCFNEHDPGEGYSVWQYSPPISFPLQYSIHSYQPLMKGGETDRPSPSTNTQHHYLLYSLAGWEVNRDRLAWLGDCFLSPGELIHSPPSFIWMSLKAQKKADRIHNSAYSPIYWLKLFFRPCTCDLSLSSQSCTRVVHRFISLVPDLFVLLCLTTIGVGKTAESDLGSG